MLPHLRCYASKFISAGDTHHPRCSSRMINRRHVSFWSPGGSIAHFAVTYMSHFGHLQKIHHVSLPGREDMDVRMLGSGRPFVLEIANARARLPPPECFDQMAASLNASCELSTSCDLPSTSVAWISTQGNP